LVWWRSPALGPRSIHCRLLVPEGWEAQVTNWDAASQNSDKWEANLTFVPVDRRPKMFRWFLPPRLQDESINIGIYRVPPNIPLWKAMPPEEVTRLGKDSLATRGYEFESAKVLAQINYSRKDRAAFNRTYKQICDSLTIE
jgi:hypothetical protein